MPTIAENLLAVRQRIASTAQHCGRSPEDIRLVAVTKTFPVAAMREALASDQTLFGENYIQEAESKYDVLHDYAQLHFIGHLQSNKAAVAAKIFQMIETVDSLKLAQVLDRHLLQSGRTMDILIQVNIAMDPKKSGIPPENVEGLLRQITPLATLKIRGLMTMPPYIEDPEAGRPHFRRLRLLAEQLRRNRLFFDNDRVELSMGMSHDFQVAIEEGATLVRVGTAIFGHRE